MGKVEDIEDIGDIGDIGDSEDTGCLLLADTADFVDTDYFLLEDIAGTDCNFLDSVVGDVEDIGDIGFPATKDSYPGTDCCFLVDFLRSVVAVGHFLRIPLS